MWKFIPEYTDYMISDKGEVKSLKYSKEHILKQTVSNSGYYTVQLSWRSKYKHYSVHRLVWEAFNGPIPKGMVINHKDENKINNSIDNLELVSYSENIMYGTARKRMVEKRSMKVKQYKDNVLITEYPSAAEAGRQTGISQGNISRSCRNGGNAGGYSWKY